MFHSAASLDPRSSTPISWSPWSYECALSILHLCSLLLLPWTKWKIQLTLPVLTILASPHHHRCPPALTYRYILLSPSIQGPSQYDTYIWFLFLLSSRTMLCVYFLYWTLRSPSISKTARAYFYLSCLFSPNMEGLGHFRLSDIVIQWVTKQQWSTLRWVQSSEVLLMLWWW